MNLLGALLVCGRPILTIGFALVYQTLSISSQAKQSHPQNRLKEASTLTITNFTENIKHICTSIHRLPIFSTRNSETLDIIVQMRKSMVCFAKARGLSLRTGAQTMLYLSLISLFFYFCVRVSFNITNDISITGKAKNK